MDFDAISNTTSSSAAPYSAPVHGPQCGSFLSALQTAAFIACTSYHYIRATRNHKVNKNNRFPTPTTSPSCVSNEVKSR